MLSTKNFIFIIFLLSWSVSLAAQAQRFHFGAMVGYNSVNLRQVNLPNVVSPEYIPLAKRAFSVGGFVRYQRSKSWSYRLEPGYSQKRLVYNSTTMKSAKVQLNYFHLPVLIQFDLDEKIHFFAGPELDWLLGVNTDLAQIEVVSGGYFSDFELSGAVGFYYSVTKHIGIGVRYSRGLTPMSNSLYNYFDGKVYHNIPTFSQCIQTSLKIEI